MFSDSVDPFYIGNVSRFFGTSSVYFVLYFRSIKSKHQTWNLMSVIYTCGQFSLSLHHSERMLGSHHQYSWRQYKKTIHWLTGKFILSRKWYRFKGVFPTVELLKRVWCLSQPICSISIISCHSYMTFVLGPYRSCFTVMIPACFTTLLVCYLFSHKNMQMWKENFFLWRDRLIAAVFVRFAPSNLVLAIHELDETHIGRFSFRTHDSFFQVCTFVVMVIFLAAYWTY